MSFTRKWESILSSMDSRFHGNDNLNFSEVFDKKKPAKINRLQFRNYQII